METRIALREWAVAVKALEEGRQTIVLRKGWASCWFRRWTPISPTVRCRKS